MTDEELFLHFELEGREYKIDRLMLPEARAIQRVTRKTFREVMAGANDGDMDCLAAILWVVLKREHPSLAWEQMDEPGGPGDVDLLSFKRLDTDADAPEPGGPQGNGQAGRHRARTTGPRKTPAGT